MTFFGFHLDSLNANLGTIVSGAFLLFIIFALVATLVMFWHWRRYGFNSRGVVLAEIIYLTGLAILLGGSFYELNFLQ